MSIRNRLLLSFLFVALLIGALGSLAFYHSIEQAESIAQEEAAAIARTMSLMIDRIVADSGSLDSSETAAALQHLTNMFKEGQKRDIFIVGRNKKIIADADPSEIGDTFSFDTHNEVGQTLQDGHIRFFIEINERHPRGIRHLVFPLETDPGKRFGVLVLEYTPLYEDILARTRENAQKYLLFYVWALLLSLGTGYMLSRHISTTLQEMQDAALKVAAGNLDVKVVSHSSDELGSLAKSFNTMTGDLQKSRDALLRSNKELMSEISERRRAEAGLERAVMATADEKAKLDAVIASIADGLSIQDTQFKVLYQNPHHKMLVGEHVGEYCYRGYQKKEAVCEGCHLALSFQDGKIYKKEQFRDTPDGRRYYEIVSSPIRNAAGDIIAGIELVREITDRKKEEEDLKRHRGLLEEMVRGRTAELLEANENLLREVTERTQAEVSLRDSEKRFRDLSQKFQTVLDGIRDPVFQLTRDLAIVWANKGTDAGLGTGASIQGRYCYALWHGRTAPCEDCAALKSFATGEAAGAQVTTAGGRLFDERSFPVRDEDGSIGSVVVVAADITEKTSLQAEAMRAGHLASLGELAAGVAHEINNPINGVINYAQMLADRLKQDSQEGRVAQRIIQEGKRIAAIVHSLLSFARERKDDKSDVHVGEVLNEVLNLTGTQSRKDGIRVKLDIAGDLPLVTANPQQLQQVFLNILSNSRYALNQKYPGGHDDKKIIIRAEKLCEEPRQVRISITDFGTGIPAGILHKITHPFFTTKPAGSGTGLGLSISYGLIRDHGGTLHVESEQGRMTRVIIELPAAGTDGR